MDRRSFIKTSSLAGLGASVSALSAPAIAKGNLTWRMVTAWPKNFPCIGVGAQRLADRITTASGGRLTIKVYSAGELVPPLQSLDAVIDGSAEMSHSASYFWQNKSSALCFFTGTPFGMTSRELASVVRVTGGQEIWDELYDQFGVQGFMAGNTGTQAGGWFRKKLSGIDSIKGLRFRTPGLGGQIWTKLGATVANIAMGDVFQALQTGTLDAAEFVGPYNDLALGLYQVAKNYYLPSFTEPGSALELVVSKAKYRALPADLQAIVKDACQAEYDQVTSDYYANDPRALKSLVDTHGVIVRPLPDDIVKAGAGASRDMLTTLRSSNDALTRKTAESFIKALDILRTRTENTDNAFVAARKAYFTM